VTARLLSRICAIASDLLSVPPSSTQSSWSEIPASADARRRAVPPESTALLLARTDEAQLAATLQTIAGTVEVPAGSGLSWTADALPGVTLSNASASAESASTDGNSVSWTLPTLGTSTVAVSFDATYTGATDDTIPAVATSTLTWDDGTSESQALSGPKPTVTLGLGTHTFRLTVDDGRGGTATDTVVVTVDDPTPPVVTPVVSGTAHDGWYTSDVSVAFTVADAESPVASKSGCDPVTVSTDTTGQTFTCTASSAATAPGSASVTVKRDATAPVVAFAGVRSSYELTDTVSITCSATDATSGVASATCPGLSAPAYEAIGKTLEAKAADRAGNVGTATATVNVDVTAGGVCGLVHEWVANGGVANSLCVKLRHGDLGAFRNEVAAQSGKKLTAAHAATLTALSRRL
jgi:hypothetical protein